jgi:hypothetical protein
MYEIDRIADCLPAPRRAKVLGWILIEHPKASSLGSAILQVPVEERERLTAAYESTRPIDPDKTPEGATEEEGAEYIRHRLSALRMVTYITREYGT